MAQMPAVCTTCKDPVNAEFDPVTGARTSITLTFALHVEDQCFVRDTIEFLDGGQIIFSPRKKEGYFDNYNVVCRKLFISGGKAPGKVNPCSPDDPGRNYEGNNVITWAGRLQTAGNGADFSSAAADGTSFDPNKWEDKGQGNDGKNGERGKDGSNQDGTAGNPSNAGGNGINALGMDTRERRPTINIVALEVEFASPASHLVIDWNGQTAGNGGKGQNGGRGGDGMGGRDGSTDESVWGDSCERGPGSGGDSGDGGNGGKGGKGGNGGNAGDIFIVSLAPNLVTGGVFKGGQVHYVNGGGDGGDPGDGGRGGRPGAKVGRKGKKTSECDEADHDGQVGNPGNPDPVGTGGTVSGAPGANGAPGHPVAFEVIAPPASGTCADLIPSALKVLSIAPNSGAKGTAVPVVITGVGFDAVTPANNQVLLSGPGITVGALTVTATTIACSLTINNLTPTTARDVTVKVGLTNTATLVGGFTVV